MTKVVIVGSINEDVFLDVVDLPRMGETVAARRVSRSTGGKGANQAVAAARLGARVELVAATGVDDSGLRVRRDVASSGVDVTHLVAVDVASTGAAYIAVDDSAENTIIVAGGANLLLGADAFPDVDLAGATVGLCMEVSDEVIVTTVRKATAVGSRVVLNLSPVRDLPEGVLSGIDVLLVNEHEAAHLAGSAVEGTDGVRRLRNSLGVAALVVTLGSRGAVVCSSDLVDEVGCPTVVAVDTTGCGDAFAGALIAAVAAGRSLTEAARLAAAVGAYAATKRGAQPSYPDLSEFRDWVEKLGLGEFVI
ncbi:MAG: ribokinase [Microbacteriaceae bacterium]|nr:MAG: ribokinase [Microbacteriaceae bacterium]